MHQDRISKAQKRRKADKRGFSIVLAYKTRKADKRRFSVNIYIGIVLEKAYRRQTREDSASHLYKD